MTNRIEKKQVTIKLSPKQLSELDQLVSDSGMNRSEVLGKFIQDYKESMRKKICA